MNLYANSVSSVEILASNSENFTRFFFLCVKDCYKFDSPFLHRHKSRGSANSYFLSRKCVDIFAAESSAISIWESSTILCRPRFNFKILCCRQRRKTCLFTTSGVAEQKIFMFFSDFVCLDKSRCKQICRLNTRVNILKQLCQSFLCNDLFKINSVRQSPPFFMKFSYFYKFKSFWSRTWE